MEQIARHLFALFIHLGGLGLLVLGVLDSSFLFMPLGNDILLVALTARKHELMPYFAAMASIGSTLGCLLVDAVVRKGGEEGLARHLAPRRLEYVKCKVNARAGWAVALACIMPPPFPFTPVIMGAAALQYPRRKMLAIVAGMRMARFSAEGALAIRFGRHILRLARAPAVHYAVLALAVLCLAGSAISVSGWIKRSRRA